MGKFTAGKRAIAMCDRCGFRYELKQLKALIVKGKNTNILACPYCWEPDQPQLMLGSQPVEDPQALRNPRPELGYDVSGTGGDGGSRITQWGWNPVGLNDALGLGGVLNSLTASVAVGSVSVTVS